MHKKALRKNIPIFTLLGVFFSLCFGLVLSLSCYVLYTDFFRTGSGSGTELSSESYIILNKKIGLLNMFGSKQPVFSQNEIEELESQPFVQEVAEFEAAKFRIKAYAPMHEERSFYTDLFLESIPSKFLDVDNEFEWIEGKPQLPVIVPRTYLNLYNFGFAPSQGLPQITESTASTLTIKMEMVGPGGKHTFWGRIHDFTDRVNSILVPQEFMDWANKNIGEVESGESSRVIVKSKNTSDPELNQYIKNKGYSTNSELLEASKAASAFKLILGFEFVQALIILLLSLGLITLSTLLLVERNKNIIYKLRLQGINISDITIYYTKFFVVCSLLAILFGMIVVFIFRPFYLELITSVGFPVSHSWSGIIFIGLSLTIFSSVLAYFIINSRVKSIL